MRIMLPFFTFTTQMNFTVKTIILKYFLIMLNAVIIQIRIMFKMRYKLIDIN